MLYFLNKIQSAWQDPCNKTFCAEKHVQFEYPPNKEQIIKNGRIDIYYSLKDGTACISEIKATDWDKIKHRRKTLGPHRRQVFKYIDQFLMLRNINVCATVIYPRPPRSEEIRNEVEEYLNEWAIQVKMSEPKKPIHYY